MSVSAEGKPSSERPVEIGPAPYYHRSDCHICQKQDGLKTGSALLDAPRPGGYIVEGENFVAEHAPVQESSAGTVILEARRHLLDFGEMTPAELADVGSILNRLVPAIKAATGGPARLFPGGDGARSPLPPLARTEEERGRTSGSGLPGAAAPSYHLIQRGRSDVAQDPRAVRAVLTAVPGPRQCERPGVRDRAYIAERLQEVCQDSGRPGEASQSASRSGNCGTSRSAQPPRRRRHPGTQRGWPKWDAMPRVLAAAGRSSRSAAVLR